MRSPFRTVLITNCTARKKAPASQELRISALPRGSITAIAHEWATRVRQAPSLLPAIEMYMGRAIREAERAALAIGGELYVVSAGLGLVSASQRIPSYEATISGAHGSNPIRKAHDRSSAHGWWQQLTHNLEAPSPVRGLVETTSRDTIIVVALSRPYLSMIADELAGLSMADIKRLRILSHGSANGLPTILNNSVISYGETFDGPDSPLPGTKADFLQRVAFHFVTTVLTRNHAGSCDEHRRQVDEALSIMALPVIPVRKRLSDDDLVQLIRDHLPSVDHGSSRMLRHLRDNLMVSCEQGRFRNLFRVAVLDELNKDCTGE